MQENKYYFNQKDSKYHKCYYTCSECLNFEPNETNHFCLKCSYGYSFLDNTSNCYFLINSQINQNPILLVNESYPFLLTINDNDYYYLLCSSKILKIEKISGNIINSQNFTEYSSDSIYAGDNLNNNYIFFF